MPLLAASAGDVAYYALAFFLVASGVGLAYVFLNLGATFARLSSFIRGTEQELLPVIHKLGESVDKVNLQLDKVDQVTDSAVDMADSADTAVRAVSMAIARPVEKVSGLAAGLSHGLSAFRKNARLERVRPSRQGGRRPPRARSRGGVAQGGRAAAAAVVEEIVVTIPRERPFGTVAGLVLGGVAARHELTLDVLDDLQLALETLLDRVDDDGEVNVVLRVETGTIGASIGPFPHESVAELERESDGTLGLRRLLETTVDDVELTDRDDGWWVELTKDFESASGEG